MFEVSCGMLETKICDSLSSGVLRKGLVVYDFTLVSPAPLHNKLTIVSLPVPLSPTIK